MIYVMKNKKGKKTPRGQFNSDEELAIHLSKNNLEHQKYINEKKQAYKKLGMKYEE